MISSDEDDDMNSVEIQSKHYSKSRSRQKLDEFRQEGRYCDVTIRVGEITKTCHRAILASISEFFNAMFCSKFRENYNEEIVLPEVDPVAFESILKFAYLEEEPNFSIPENNVYDMGLLKACDFLGILDLVDFCISHIVKRMSSIKNLCEIFVFACVSNHPTLSDALSTRIAENFYQVSSSEDFLLLPYEQLNTILEKRKSLDRPSEFVGSSIFNDREDLLLDALIRWTLYSCQERKRYFLDKLVPIVNFERISNNYLKFISNNYRCQMNLYSDNNDFQSSLTAFIASGSVDTLPSVVYKDPLKNIALHVYVEYTRIRNGESKNEVTYVYSISKYKSEWSSFNLEDHSFSPISNKRNFIALDEPNNYLYTLHKFRKKVLEFSSYSSASMVGEKTLTVPPYCGTSSKMCGFQNDHIYLYNDNDACPIPSCSSRMAFSTDETPAILNYQCEMDEWFTIPKMRTRMSAPGIVADDKLVYLIGGMDLNGKKCSGFVQAYDYRVSKWLELTKPDTSISCIDGKYCYLNGKIYASDAQKIDVFDPVARQWKVLSFNNHQNLPLKIQQIVPFENHLWIFCYNKKLSKFETIIFDPKTENWFPCKSIDDLIDLQKESYNDGSSSNSDSIWDCDDYSHLWMDEEADHSYYEADIVNAVVFKPM